ncbi:hypothetical protein Bca101_061953 [Brassica carinata]
MGFLLGRSFELTQNSGTTRGKKAGNCPLRHFPLELEPTVGLSDVARPDVSCLVPFHHNKSSCFHEFPNKHFCYTTNNGKPRVVVVHILNPCDTL